MNDEEYIHTQELNQLKHIIDNMRKDLENHTQLMEERLDTLDDYLEDREETINRILTNLEYMRND